MEKTPRLKAPPPRVTWNLIAPALALLTAHLPPGQPSGAPGTAYLLPCRKPRVTYPLGTQGAPEHPPRLFSLALAPLRGLSFKPQLCCLSQDRPPELKRCSMARGCLQGVKYLMFAFNLLFWLGGCGILGVGIWLAATQGNFATLSSSFPSLSAANLLIVTGTFVMAIGFVGCIGAIKENKCLLLTLLQVSSTCQMFPSGLGPLGAAVLRAAAAGVPAGGLPRHPLLRLHRQGWPCCPADRQVCTAGPEKGPTPVWHPG
ncbi:tetraspanin-4 isoform X8 [Tursiops truncatus]|uniref:tetraspanin-4 isoform X8 n=1 Tax=Tursiops truncatus TaxID=9739 RepID=UPI003CCF2E41